MVESGRGPGSGRRVARRTAEKKAGAGAAGRVAGGAVSGGVSGSVAPARAAAFEILLKMEGGPAQGSAHSDELLRGRRVESLAAQDRHLAMTLVMGTLRWQIALDARIAKLLDKPESTLSAEVRTALRLGAFQLLHLDRIPAHAAIGESVELAKRGGFAYAAGMVNAVLRKLAMLAAEAPAVVAGPFASVEEMARALGHPAWMVERWAGQYGVAVAEKICAYDQAPPPITVRLLGEDAEAALVAEGIALEAGKFLSRARRVVKGDVTATRAWREGLVRIQDEGSQLVAEIAGSAQGGRILDMCAAPGGKTAILAERNPLSAVVACDISEKRLEAMQKMLPASVAARVRFVTGDAATTQFDSKFELILADVPCSGTGTLARNPEIRHRLTVGDLKRQQQRQVEILLAGMAALGPRGKLVYSSCSLEPEENEAVVEAALKRRRGFRVQPLEPVVEGLTSAGVVHAEGAGRLKIHALQGGALRTVPGVDGCDGFFAVMLAVG